MTVKAIGDEELLDYVLEKDFEDTTARIILGAASSFEEGVGRVKLSKLLRGKDPGMILSGEFELRDHFGRLSLLDPDQVLDFIESLVRLGLLEVSGSDFPRLKVTRSGLKSLRSGKNIPAMIPWPLPGKDLPLPVDPELYDDLKKERNHIAREEGIPPYCIAPNLSLVEIVNRGITDIDELPSIPGIGEKRSEKYGERLLSLVQTM
jgi:ATP-dependent DNA helicase RecQ